MKKCRKCKQLLPLTDFYKNRKTHEATCKKCRLDSNRNRYTLICNVCNKEFKCETKNQKCCSRQCASQLRIATLTIPCEICQTLITRSPSLFEGKTYIYCSVKCKNLGWSKYFSGVNSPIRNHDLTEDDRLIARHYPEYYKWRDNVFKKDGYSCVKCSDNQGGNLNAHHILNYSEHIDIRLDVNNGITFCESCHKLFHNKYGYRNNNNKQLQEFVNI